MQKIDSEKLAERLMSKLNYFFDGYYLSDGGDLQIQEIIKETIDEFIQESNKRGGKKS